MSVKDGIVQVFLPVFLHMELCGFLYFCEAGFLEKKGLFADQCQLVSVLEKEFPSISKNGRVRL